MGTDMFSAPCISLLAILTVLGVTQNVDAEDDFYGIRTVKRSLFKRLPGMTGLSLMNPWHAARTLLNPEVPESLHYNQIDNAANGRQERSVIDELIPMGPDFMKSKYRAVGPMFKRGLDTDDLEDLGPKYVNLGLTAMLEDPTSIQKKNMEIMRFGKRAI